MEGFVFGFEEQLMDEYFRAKRQIAAELDHIEEIGHGWTVNIKHKNGRSYYYREKRVNGKVVSQYVKKEDVPELLENDKEVSRWKRNISRQKEFMKRVERYFGKEMISQYESYYASEQRF
jgi:hypothetical protein